MREVDAERIREILEDKAAAEKLRSFGLSKEEGGSKMAKMTHGQIHQLASLSDRITAGGGLLSSLFVLVFIVVLALVLILVVAAA